MFLFSFPVLLGRDTNKNIALKFKNVEDSFFYGLVDY